MKRLLYTLITAGVLFSSNLEKASTNVKNIDDKNYAVLPTKVNPYELKENYISGKELEKILTKLNHLIPKEFSKKDLEKIALIESSLNSNAYREDINKKRINGKIEKDTVRQGGIYQITEENYNASDNEEPFLFGVFEPSKNTELFLKNLRTIKRFYINKFSGWDSLNRKEKQKYLLAGHNYGIGKIQKTNFDLEKVPRITKEFFNKFYSLKNRKN